jgi:hypothetical protein
MIVHLARVDYGDFMKCFRIARDSYSYADRVGERIGSSPCLACRSRTTISVMVIIGREEENEKVMWPE